jgi:hypothetical protein
MYTPAQVAAERHFEQIDKALLQWLRSLPVADRVAFIAEVWPTNCNRALELVRRGQLPIPTVVDLLKGWLRLGQHNAADRLITYLVPVLGEERFWAIVAEVELSPAMADFLNYHSGGRLERERVGK